MPWWRNQNLEGPHHGPDNTKWHFCVWHGHVAGLYLQRIFFWNDAQDCTGLAELKDSETLHVTKIRDLQRRIAHDAAYRERLLRPLRFPLERAWSES